jgi:hypothetical protein
MGYYIVVKMQVKFIQRPLQRENFILKNNYTSIR